MHVFLILCNYYVVLLALLLFNCQLNGGGVPHAGGPKCLKLILAYIQSIRIEYSKSQIKSQKSESKKSNPGH